MKTDRSHPPHRSLTVFDSRPTMVFVTVCTHSRKPILAHHDAMKTVLSAWKKATAWLVGKYVIMPDHIHLFCVPNDIRFSLSKWVRYWKSLCSQNWPWKDHQPIWQIDFWDTQMRSAEKYMFQWQYVEQNPVRKGLVRAAKEWPYRGEVNCFGWY